jgi:hypothetical protein
VRSSLALALTLAACHHSTPPPEHPTEKSTADADPDPEPQIPFDAPKRTVFRVGEGCGQGPYRIEAEALSARYGEQLTVYWCSPHKIRAYYQGKTVRPDGFTETSEGNFGATGGNAACKAERAVEVHGDAATKSGSGSGSGGGKPPGDAAKPTETATAPRRLDTIADMPTNCYPSEMFGESWASPNNWALEPKTRFVIDVWSNELEDFDGAVFVIDRQAVAAEITEERWQALFKARQAWADRYWAKQDASPHVADNKTKTSTRPPPPPAPRAETQPPRPSTNARWIPGYWHYEDSEFHWVGGLWNVPASDVAKQLTVVAPTAPPTTKHDDRPVEPRPTRVAVWTPGYWSWDGRAYLWVAGAWRIPPAPGQTWQPARWIAAPRGVRFAPGGWRAR